MKRIQNIQSIFIVLMSLVSYQSFGQCDPSVANDDVIITITSIDANGCDGDPFGFSDLEAAISINGTVFEFSGVNDGGNTPVTGANEGCNGGSNTINLGPTTAGTSMVSTMIEIWEEDGCGACSYGTGTFCNDDADHAPPTAVNIDISQPTGSFSTGSCLVYNYEVSCPMAVCPVTVDFTVPDVCSGSPINWVAGGACDIAGTFGTGVVVDMYIYDDGTTNEAPAGYMVNVSAPTESPGTGADDILLSNPDISLINFDFNCTDNLPTHSQTNITCEPIVFTYFLTVLAWADAGGIDSDGDLQLEYIPACIVERYDVTVYPDGFTVRETAGTCDGTASMVEVLAADGTVCASETAAAPPTVVCPTTSATDMFAYNFTAADLGLDMAPATCQPALSGQIDVTCTTVCCEIMDPTTTPATICEGDAPAALVATPTGAACTTINWFSDAGGTSMVGTGSTFTPTDTAPGTYTYYAQCVDATIADCESMLIPADFIVNALPVVTLSTPALSCGAGPQALNPSPAGGTYSGTGAPFVANDAIDGEDLTVGIPYNLTYTYTSPEGCVGSQSISFTFIPDCDADGGAFPTGP